MSQLSVTPHRIVEKYGRYCSLGLIWAWVFCSWKTELLFPGLTRSNILSDPSWLGNVVFVIIWLAATPLLAKRLGKRGRRILTAAATIAMVIGVFASAAFAGSTGSAIILSRCAGALTGFGSGVLLSVCGAQLTRLSVEELEWVVPLNVLFTPLCSLFTPALTGSVVGVAFVAALPLAAGILLLTSSDVLPERIVPAKDAGALPHPSQADIRGMLVSCLLYHVASSSIILTRSTESVPANFGSLAGFFQTSLAFGSVATLIVCLVLMSRTRYLDFQSVCHWSIPALLIGAALLPEGSVPVISMVSSCLIAFSTTYFSMICYVIFVRFAKQGLIGPYGAIGFFMSACEIGVLSGNLMGVAALNASTGFDPLQVQVSVIVIAAALAMLVVPPRPLRVHSEASSALVENAEPEPQASSVAPARQDEQSRRAATARAMRRLAEQHGLTAREEEVCSLLASGRSRPYIRETLCVSKNTVDTHVKHAYVKLGIHSNQELVDLLEAQDGLADASSV